MKITLSAKRFENCLKCEIWVEDCFYLWNIAVWKVVKVCNCLIKILLKFWKILKKILKKFENCSKCQENLKIALSVRKVENCSKCQNFNKLIFAVIILIWIAVKFGKPNTIIGVLFNEAVSYFRWLKVKTKIIAKKMRSVGRRRNSLKLQVFEK